MESGSANFRVILAFEGDFPADRGQRNGRDCHVEPDRVLIYKLDGNELHLVRTGTQSDLF